MTTTPMPEQLDKFCTCDDCKPMECEGCRVNRKRRAAIEAEGDAKDAETAKKYSELICAVASKWPNESRHETALRYIRRAESGWYPLELGGDAEHNPGTIKITDIVAIASQEGTT